MGYQQHRVNIDDLCYLVIIWSGEIVNFLLGFDVPDLDGELVEGQWDQLAQVLAFARTRLNSLDGVAALVFVQVINAKL